MKRTFCFLLVIALLLPLCFGCDDSSMHDGSGAEDGSQAETPPTQDPPAQDPPAQDPPTQAVSVPKIIYDTDMDCDCDDVGALALVLEYMNAGKADLLGVVTDVPSRYAAAACEALCLGYGVSVPIGTIYEDEYPLSESDRYKDYRETQANNISSGKDYNRVLAQTINKTDDDYPSSAEVYRRLLAAAEDKSVTVVVVGMLTAIDALFLTEGDEISPLSGLELFEKKVIKVISMGQMQHAQSPKLRSFNYTNDREGAVNVFRDCPVPIYISGAGGDIAVGYSYSSMMPSDHPVRKGYEVFLKGKNKGRSSWDLIAMLYALDPDEALFSVLPLGKISYHNFNNYAMYNSNGTRGDGLIVLNTSNEEMARLLERQTNGLFH